MKINNVELELDVMDAEIAERIESNLEALKNTVVPEGSAWSDIIKIQCEATFKFFDDSFGEGMALNIFGNKTNLRMCVNAIEDFKTEFEKEVQSSTNELKMKLGKYSPNRAQRRSK